MKKFPKINIIKSFFDVHKAWKDMTSSTSVIINCLLYTGTKTGRVFGFKSKLKIISSTSDLVCNFSNQLLYLRTVSTMLTIWL